MPEEIPNAIEEQLGTVRNEKFCGCVLHTKDGPNNTRVPIEKYYGTSRAMDDETGLSKVVLVLHETIRCERHSTIEDLQALHDKLKEEDIILSQATEVMKANVGSQHLREEYDEWTGDKYISMKKHIGFTFEGGVLYVLYPDFNEEEKVFIKAKWDTDIGINKVNFYG